MRQAILMVSLGRDRPWKKVTSELFRKYAERCHADFHLLEEPPGPEELPMGVLPESPGRPNKLAYACKAYFVWKYLNQGYERVLVVDDTCCVRPLTNNIFEAVPEGMCGYVRTSSAHAKASFDQIGATFPDSGIKFDQALYMNSGVMLYDRSARDALSPKEIVDAKRLLFAKHPHQTLTYYLLQKHGVRMFQLGRGFNHLIAVNELPRGQRYALKDPRPYLSPGIHIFHVTSPFKHRSLLIQRIAEQLEREACGGSPEQGTPHHQRKKNNAINSTKERTKSGETARGILATFHTEAPTVAYIANGLRRIAVDPTDARARQVLQRRGFRYFSGIQTFIYSCLSELPVDLFFDVGANYGECAFAAPLYSKTRTIGYEANEGLHSYLEKSRGYNDDLANIRFVHSAMSSQAEGTLTFYVDKDWSGKSSAIGDESKPNQVRMTVPATSLDREFETWGQGCSLLLLKVDVEGYEASVFHGARNVVQTVPNLVCLVEFDSKFLLRAKVDPPQFFARLSADFTVYRMTKGTLRKCETYKDLEGPGEGRIQTNLVLSRFTDKNIESLFLKQIVAGNQRAVSDSIGVGPQPPALTSSGNTRAKPAKKPAARPGGKKRSTHTRTTHKPLPSFTKYASGAKRLLHKVARRLVDLSS